MSYESLLTDRCDLYRLNKGTTESYGVPIQDSVVYDQTPTKTDVRCKFVRKQARLSEAPLGNEITQTFLVHFPISETINLNDKVIWNGIAFRLEIPQKIRNHHIEVTAVRDRFI